MIYYFHFRYLGTVDEAKNWRLDRSWTSSKKKSANFMLGEYRNKMT